MAPASAWRRGRLEIAECHFEDNENGVLANNDDAIELSVDRCSFVENGAGDGQSHNLYAGVIGRLTVSASYFARSRMGHLLKSRARESLIAYSRLSGEDGTSSYELEFPNGGMARVLGCLIQQGSRTENATIISYGAEGYRWPHNEIHVAFNTIVNDRLLGGVFVRVASGPVRAEVLDNLLVGPGRLDVKADSAVIRNSVGRRSEFADPTRLNYRLIKSSPHVGAAGPSGQRAPSAWHPTREYLHPANSRELPGVRSADSTQPRRVSVARRLVRARKRGLGVIGGRSLAFFIISKRPACAGLLLGHQNAQSRRRRAAAPSPASASPSNATVPGSGTLYVAET